MKRSLRLHAPLFLCLMLPYQASAQSYTPTGLAGQVSGLAASAGTGLLDYNAPFGTGTAIANYAAPGSTTNLGGGLVGSGYSDAGYALAQDPALGTFYRRAPSGGGLTEVVSPGGLRARSAQMNPVTGDVTFQASDNGFYRLDASGSHALPAPPGGLAQWGRPNGSNAFVGNDLANSYLFDGSAWRTVARGSFSSLLLTNVDLFGTVDYMTGVGTVGGNQVVVGARRNGSGYDLFDTGLSSAAYGVSPPDELGRFLATSGLDSVLGGIGGSGAHFANPAGMTPLVGLPMASNGLFAATMYDANFAPSVFTLRVQAVPEPASLAALGAGALGLALRRRRGRG